MQYFAMALDLLCCIADFTFALFAGVVAVCGARICKLLRSPGIDSKKSILLVYVARGGIFKLLRSPGIDSKESIPGLLKFTNSGSGGPVQPYCICRHRLRLHRLAELILGIDSWAPSKFKNLGFRL
jgi:hypothetical protein